MGKTEKTTKSGIVRPPIVTVLGHVDHGKTSILDYIRRTNIAGREYGGITQHIGAYQIEVPPEIQKKQADYTSKITFIDTPGHEAFAKMRSQGAAVADIAILVVAANDGVKPQTIESISHIKNANIPAIVALNKIDLPDVNAEKIKKQLHKEGLKLEEYGGEVPVVSVSAKNGTGMDKLLEMIVFLSDFNQIKAKPDDTFTGVVIESTVSKFRGITATVLVRSGRLSTADIVVNEGNEFKIRALINWSGKQIKEITPGDPAEILGWKKIPQVGSRIYKKSESNLEVIPEHAIEKIKEKALEIPPGQTLPEVQTIKLIIKADTLGTLEAIAAGIPQDAEIIQQAVGNINESDILLAKTAKALVIGFNQKLSDQVSKLAQTEKVLVKTYNIIYELFDEIEDVITAIQKGDMVEILGTAKVMATFEMKKEFIAGAKVTSGRIARGDQVKIMREETEIGRTKIKSLKHFKEDITKAESGKEVGIGLAQKMEILTGDSIISIG